MLGVLGACIPSSVLAHCCRVDNGLWVLLGASCHGTVAENTPSANSLPDLEAQLYNWLTDLAAQFNYLKLEFCHLRWDNNGPFLMGLLSGIRELIHGEHLEQSCEQFC